MTFDRVPLTVEFNCLQRYKILTGETDLHTHDGEGHRREQVVELFTEFAEDISMRCEFRGLFEGVLIVGIASEGDDTSRGHDVACTVDDERATVGLVGAIHHFDDKFRCLLVIARLTEVTCSCGWTGDCHLLAIDVEGGR